MVHCYCHRKQPIDKEDVDRGQNSHNHLYRVFNLYYLSKYKRFVDFAFDLFIEEDENLEIITSILSFFVKIIGIKYFADMVIKKS